MNCEAMRWPGRRRPIFWRPSPKPADARRSWNRRFNRARTPQAKADLIYWRLRRAEITLVKEVQTPARSERLDQCPAPVRQAAARFLNTQRSRSGRRSRQ